MASLPQTALCSALDVGIADDGGVPEWVHLLPAGKITTVDGRGPYTVPSMQAIADRLKAGGKTAIDECHATDKAVLGTPAPAKGWIVDAEARPDGLWGKVEWTGTGRALMADKAYRGISPVISHDKNMRVLGVVRASLVNNPNLTGLTALHAQELASVTLLEKIRARLGLAIDADDATIDAALATLDPADPVKPVIDPAKPLVVDPAKPAIVSAAVTDPVATDPAAVAVADVATHAILANPVVIALQSELATTTATLNALVDAGARKEATAFVDAAIAAGHVGLKPVRGEYIDLHMADPARAAKMIAAMPVLTGETHAALSRNTTDDAGLTGVERSMIAMMGIDEAEYVEQKKKLGVKTEAL